MCYVREIWCFFRLCSLQFARFYFFFFVFRLLTRNSLCICYVTLSIDSHVRCGYVQLFTLHFCTCLVIVLFLFFFCLCICLLDCLLRLLFAFVWIFFFVGLSFVCLRYKYVSFLLCFTNAKAVNRMYGYYTGLSYLRITWLCRSKKKKAKQFHERQNSKANKEEKEQVAYEKTVGWRGAQLAYWLYINSCIGAINCNTSIKLIQKIKLGSCLVREFNKTSKTGLIKVEI